MVHKRRCQAKRTQDGIIHEAGKAVKLEILKIVKGAQFGIHETGKAVKLEKLKIAYVTHNMAYTKLCRKAGNTENTKRTHDGKHIVRNA